MNLDTVRLQLKSMNAVDLDEEFLDVTVFMTFEWSDPNLAWTVNEKQAKDKNKTSEIVDGKFKKKLQ